MKIATVTLNPAIDQTVWVNDFRPNTVNRGQSMAFSAAGKGVNVASFLADHGNEVAATGFLGRDNPELFERLFAEKGIEDHFVRIGGGTRIGVKITDAASQQTTDINLPGLSPTPEAVTDLWKRISFLAEHCDWFVLSGNLPPAVPAGIYAELIEFLKARGKSVVLDTSGEALRLGVEAGPTIVKPNVHELEEIVGSPLEGVLAVERTSRQLLSHGIRLVAVSMGEQGAWFVDEQSAFIAVPPAVTVCSTVGAGDAMVAGLVAGMIRGMDLPDCARLATAFSVAAITRSGGQALSPHALESNIPQVSLRALER